MSLYFKMVTIALLLACTSARAADIQQIEVTSTFICSLDGSYSFSGSDTDGILTLVQGPNYSMVAEVYTQEMPAGTGIIVPIRWSSPAPGELVFTGKAKNRATGYSIELTGTYQSTGAGQFFFNSRVYFPGGGNIAFQGIIIPFNSARGITVDNPVADSKGKLTYQGTAPAGSVSPVKVKSPVKDGPAKVKVKGNGLKFSVPGTLSGSPNSPSFVPEPGTSFRLKLGKLKLQVPTSDVQITY